MKCLIDTQILIWSIIDTSKLSKKALKELKNSNNEIFISSVSIWEISIKISIKKLILPFEMKNIIQEINNLNINILDINSEYFIKFAELPFHHKDTFDRLIITHAMLENIPVISSDFNFKKYDIELIW